MKKLFERLSGACGAEKVFSCRWLWLGLFAVVWCALRLFWLTCDTGVPATWEYGFHTTDEGYYLCGGKEMFLWGSFVDVLRREALNYCYSYGTHWLSYLAHLVFGLSTWAWRIPFTLIYFTAWMMTFVQVARRSGTAFSFFACVAVSSLPLVVTYERGASNDALIAALLAIAYALACGSGVWRIFAAALATSAIATVKPSVWVMIPMVLCGVLEERKTRHRGIDAVLFVVSAVAFTFGWKLISALTVLGEADRCGMSPWQVLLQVNATYGLPSISDILRDLRAVASFPRDPSVRIMGATSVLISAVPAAMFLFNVARRRWSARLLLYGSIAAYAYALNVINSMYTHYFLPLLIMLPTLFSVMGEDLSELRDECKTWRRLSVELALGAAIIAVAVLLLSTFGFDVRKSAELYSRIHNLPQRNPWLMTWPAVVAGALFGIAAVALNRGLKALMREGWVWTVAFLLVFSAAAAGLPAAVIAPHLRLMPSVFYLPVALNAIAGGLIVYALFVSAGSFASRRFALMALVVPVLASYLLLPTWRQAAVELVSRRTFHDRELARELSALVPSDAIVLGERSNQAFMSLPVRTASLFIHNSVPQSLVDELLRRDPGVKLYGLFDSQHAYCLQNMSKCADRYTLKLVKTFKMPSFADGRPADVHLCRIVAVKKAVSP